MENENAYQAPEADVVIAPEEGADYIYTGPKSTGVGNGITWIADGFKLFRADPGQWILTMIVGFIILLVVSLIPFVSIINGLFTYVWVGGLMIGCQAVADNKPFKLDYLFAGFKHRLAALVGLSCVMFLISMVLMFAILGGAYFEMMMTGEADAVNVDPLGFMLSFLLVLALLLPVIMAVWFAPALITLQNMSVFSAMKASFMGCLFNVVPFLIYGILALVIYILGAIPLMLGLLVVVPTLFGSMFASYQDVFLTKQSQDTF